MITVVLFVSRDFLLEKLFNRIGEMKTTGEPVNLLVVVDGGNMLYQKTRNLSAGLDSSINDFLVVRAPYTEKRQPSQQYRRRRIAALHNFSKEFIMGGDYVFGIEDDTLFPKNALRKLKTTFESKKNVGFVEALEVGRWTTPYIGAWRFDNVEEPSVLESVDPKEKGIREIDSGGFYCYFTSRENYERYAYSPIESYNFGPDIFWGLKLRRDGYRNYIDMSIICEHHTERGFVITPETKTPRLVRLENKYGAWRFVQKVQHA